MIVLRRSYPTTFCVPFSQNECQPFMTGLASVYQFSWNFYYSSPRVAVHLIEFCKLLSISENDRQLIYKNMHVLYI